MPTPIESEHTKAKSLARLFRDDTRFALGRIAVFQYLSVAIFLILISGFWILQVRDNAENNDLAERNRIKTEPLLAPRGKILDRDGRIIVDSHSAYRVMLARDRLKPSTSTASAPVCIWTRTKSAAGSNVSVRARNTSRWQFGRI